MCIIKRVKRKFNSPRKTINRMRKHIIIYILSSIFCLLSYGQKEDYSWILGNTNLNIIKFGNTSYILDTLIPSAPIRIFETNASISDSAGNLVSFTGGAAVNVAYWSAPNPLSLQQQVYKIGSPTLPLFPNASEIYPQASSQFPSNPNWFQQSGSSDFDCSSSTYFIAPPNPPNVALMELTAEGKLEFSQFEEEINKQQQIDLFEKMKADASLSNLSFKIDSFYEENRFGVMQQMYEAKESKEGIESAALSEKQLLELAKMEMDSLIVSLSVLDSIHANDSLISQSYLQQKEALMQILTNKIQVMKSLQEQIKLEEEIKIDETYLKYHGIIDNELIQKNERTVNEIWLSTYVKGLDPISSQVQYINSIAEQCPVSGGNAVYAARSFMQQVSRDSLLFWEDYDRCLLAGFDVRKTDGEEIADLINAYIKVYPNPAAHFVNIEYKKEGQGCIHIILSSLTGQVVKSEDLCDTNLKVLEVSNLGTGVYYLRIFEEGQLIHQEKLIIK
jgi:hypothetical protein